MKRIVNRRKLWLAAGALALGVALGGSVIFTVAFASPVADDSRAVAPSPSAADSSAAEDALIVFR